MPDTFDLAFYSLITACLTVAGIFGGSQWQASTLAPTNKLLAATVKERPISLSVGPSESLRGKTSKSPIHGGTQ